jgi:hypothetical protein
MDQRRVPGGFLPRASRALALALGLIACARSFSAQPPGQFSIWKFDSLHQKNGKVLQGLVENETSVAVNFAYVSHNPGKPTSVIRTTIPKSEIERIDRLGAVERAQLQDRLNSLIREKMLPSQLDVKPALWGKELTPGFSYTSSHFVLLSNADKEIVRCAAGALERVYAAYAEFLPARRPNAPPTRILLVQPLSAYQQMVREQGRDLLNPAFYDPAHNQIVWACELQQLREDRERERIKNQRLRARLNEQEALWSKSHKGAMPPDLRRKLEEGRIEVDRTKNENDKIFEKGKQRFFQTLYHEAFHAYLANFVYPPGNGDIPRWLNEGLAQIFETAIIEAGELEISRPDADRLARAQRKGELVNLEDLLLSGPNDFLVGHASDRQLANRHYLTSWALAFYLTFDRKKIDLPELDRYVYELKIGSDPCKAFENLVGQPLPDFEKAFLEYLQGLRSDGSVVRVAPVKRASPQH